MKKRLKLIVILPVSISSILCSFFYVYLFVLPMKPLNLQAQEYGENRINSAIQAIKLNQSITMNDGRILSYAEYGDSLGIPVFYFHGGQESRLSAAFMDSTAKQLGVKIIAPDRPGIGNSTFQSNRSFLDWGNDISELADSLELEHFSIFGLSGGAPHVFACLKIMPHRVDRVSIVSGTTPDNYKDSRKGMWLPVKLVHWFAGMDNDKPLRKFIQADYESLVNNPEKRIKQFQKYLPDPDKELMTVKPEFGWEFINGSLESYRQGIDGVVQEWKLYVADWGFELQSIENKITLWYGSEDKMTPKFKGYFLKRNLPNAQLNLIENEGHFSLIRNHLAEILEGLIFNVER
jgi:pimeloyl-ACP methyl ester carboxylesterase